jgi:LacI family transcriptional regulator
MRRPTEHRVVLADVARLAGTSKATASRALKDDPRIGETTRAAVRAAAHKLGYVPNAAARSLRARRTHILGLLLDDLADPVHGKVAAGFEEAAAARGYAVFMMTGLHDPERERRALTVLAEHRADGVAVASCVSDPAEVFRRFPQERVVFVQPDYPALADGAEPASRGVLRSDDEVGFAVAIDHLVERGYRRIAYVGPGSGSSDALRHAAASDALERHRLGPLGSIATGQHGWRDASPIAEQLAAEPPEAVICYDDKLALSVLDALRSTRLQVPGDLALVGFDGIPAARQSRPRLTTIEVPSIAIGRRAVEMLLGAAKDSEPAPSQVVPVSLVLGESTPRRRSSVHRRAPADRRGSLAASREGGR